jgi:Uma2 family endonuclease
MGETTMSIAAAPRLKPDDLLRMGDDGKGFELVDGELRELNVSLESSRVAGEIFLQLKLHANRVHPAWVLPEGTSYQCFPDDPDRVCRPDTSVILLERMPPATYRDVGHCPIVPDLVVEVISIHDNARQVKEKIDDWLAAGAKLLWEVYPDSQTIFAHRSDGTIKQFKAKDTLTAEGLLPGFACPVADLFRLPARA